jgi:PAS domain-containing protein
VTSLGNRLHKENAIFNELFEQLPLAVALTSAENVVLRVNGEFTRVFGYAAQEPSAAALPSGQLAMSEGNGDDRRKGFAGIGHSRLLQFS